MVEIQKIVNCISDSNLWEAERKRMRETQRREDAKRVRKRERLKDQEGSIDKDEEWMEDNSSIDEVDYGEETD